jgi:hypothetical protein
MSGSLVADLGLGPPIWLFLTFLASLTLFFKFSRVWSVRNLDMLLLFALAPGMMRLVGSGAEQPWAGFLWLFAGSALWLARCVIDLGLIRRPLLEPNLNAAGLSCAAVGLLGLLVAEAVNLPVDEGAARNPADPSLKTSTQPVRSRPAGGDQLVEPVGAVLRQAPLPAALKRNPPQVILSRVLASLAHLGLVVMLYRIGARHFERPIAGLAVAVCYLLAPYTRIAVVDSGQLIPAALVVGAVLSYQQPVRAGLLIGLAAGWMPPCLALIPLWAGFYRGRVGLWFLLAAAAVALVCWVLGQSVPVLADWARALGARSLSQAGLVPGLAAPRAGSFWSQIHPAYRLPVLISHLALVIAAWWWPARKNLAELIALSAALLIASQFWYLDEGGALILIYLPLVLLMVFRPNLSAKLAPARPHPAGKPRAVATVEV